MGTIPVQHDAAFNHGGDDRMLGVPLSNCPYPTSGGRAARFWWLAGWRDVHYHWGTDVRGRWTWARPPSIIDMRRVDEELAEEGLCNGQY